MKTLLSIIVSITAAVILLVACTKQPLPGTIEISVMKDVTDKQLAEPDVNEIYPLYGISPDSLSGAVFRFKNLSDVSYTYEAEAKIEAQDFWTSNELDRIKESKRFKSSIADIITKAEQTTTGKNNSSIYIPIANELNRLAKSKSQKRILIVYSDLMENSYSLSFYNKKTLAQLKSNPEAITKQFVQLKALQNLSGIQVYFIYQPTDTYSDQTFNIVSGFYKKLLESKGATVNISANLNS